MNRGYFYGSPYRQGYSMPKASPLLQKYSEDIQCVYPSPDPTKGSIYVSNVEAAENPQTLAKYNIKAVMTCARGYDRNIPKSKLDMFQYFPFDDKETCVISPYFEKACNFIVEACQKTNVLVHCIAGVSRSVSMVLAYLIREKGMTYQDAHYTVKSRRNIISPNDGFIKQLKDYAQQIRRRMNSNSITTPTKQLTPQKVSRKQRINDEQNYPKTTIQKTKTTDFNSYKYQQEVQNEEDVEYSRSKTSFGNIIKNQSDLLSSTPARNKMRFDYEMKNNSTLLKRTSQFLQTDVPKTPQKLIKKQDIQYLIKDKTYDFQNRSSNYKQLNKQLNEKIEAIHAKYEKQREQLFAKRGYSSGSKRQRTYNYDMNQKSSAYERGGYDLGDRFSRLRETSTYSRQTIKYTNFYENNYSRGTRYADLGRTGYGMLGKYF